jgi:PAS domain S-box-containing protein
MEDILIKESSQHLESLLQQAYDRLSLAVDAAGIGCWDWNLQTGEVFYDQQWLKMIGYQPEEAEMTNTFWEDRIHPDDKQRVMQTLQDHLDNKTPSYKTEHRVRTKSGSYIWIIDSGRVIERDVYKRPLHVGGVSMDINERVLTQQIITESEEKYKSIFEHLNDGFCRFNFSGQILEVNKNLCDLINLKPTDLIGSNIKLFFNNQTIKFLHRRLSQIIENKSVNFETEIVTPSHKTLPISISARVITMNGDGEIQVLIRDIAERKEYEKALLDEKQKFKALIEHSPNIICRFGRNLKCQYASPNMLKLIGISSENCIGKRLNEIGFSESLTKYLEEKMRSVIRRNKKLMINFSFESPIGLKHFESILVPELSQSNTIESILITNSDITDKVNRERELNTSKLQLEEAEKNVHFGIYEVDLATNTTKWSNETYTIFERDAQLPPPSYDEFNAFIHPDDTDSVLRHFQNAVHDKTYLNFNFRINTPNGQTKYVNCTGRTEKNPENNQDIKLLGTFMDITEKKQIENKLFAERDVLQVIMDNIPDPIYIMNNQNQYIRANKGLAKLFGVDDPEMVIGKTAYDFFPPEVADHFNDAEQTILTSGVPSLNHEKELPTPHGNNWYSTTIIGVNDVNGQVTHLVGISRDITRYKLSEEQLRHSKDKAEQADKLKSAFLANMSHEIRTPINGILGFANLMEIREFPREKQIQYLHIINNSGKLLLNLINDIIDIAKIEAGQINIETSNVDLEKMCKDLLEFYQGEKVRRDKQHVQIEAEIPPLDCLRAIITDPLRLRQIINNLINNSLKFTEEGTITFGYQLEKRHVLFFVKDTGIGMSDGEQKIVFERFKQAGCPSKKKEGTGLGLAISKGLVELLGGEIWIKSQPGKGSEFYFTIPLNIGNQQFTQNSFELGEKRFEDFKWAGKTLLLVEDEEVNYLYVNELLINTGINLLRVVTAEEAITVCNSNKPIDLIMMDMRLPGINGFDATRLIKRIRREIPIIAQTAYAMENEKKQCIEAGCDHYMTKPFDQDILFEVLHEFLQLSN